MRGVLHRTGTGILLAATFGGSALAAVGLHASTPAFRRAASGIANDVLDGAFAGEIRVRDVEILSVGSRATVRARHVVIVDPDGKEALAADDVEAHLDLAQLVSSLVHGGALKVDVTDVRIENVHVSLDPDAAGQPGIARAFDGPKKKAEAAGKPATAADKADKTEPPEVHVRNATIAHGSVHGDVGAPLDGTVVAVRARYDLAGGVSEVHLDHATITLDAPRAPGQRPSLMVNAKGVLEVGGGQPLHAEAEVEGACGSIPLTARAKIVGRDLDGTVDVPRTTTTAIAATFDGVGLREGAPAKAHVHVHGTLPKLAIDGAAELGTATVNATGTIDATGKHPFLVDLDASKVDAQAFGASAATDLSGKVHAEGDLAAGAPAVTFHVASKAGTAAGQAVPAAAIDGKLADGKVDATIKADEPGVAASGTASFDLATKIASFDVRARSSSLRSVARLPQGPAGAATAHAVGKVDVKKKSIEGSVDASGDEIALASFSAKHVDVHGVLGGPLDQPVVQLSFTGRDLRLKSGDKKPLVYPDARGGATVLLAGKPRIEGASVTLRERGSSGQKESVTASVRSVTMDGGSVAATGLKVTGIGDPLDLDVSGSGGQWNIRAKSDGVDLHRAARVTGIQELDLLPPGTRATVDVDIHPGRGGSGPEGHLDVVVRSEKALGDGDLVAEVHATVDRGKLDGTAKVAADGFGQVEVTHAELVLPDRMDARSLARTTGTLELKGVVDLAQGAALLAGERIERASGIASFEGRIERGDPDALPAVRATVRTTGLDLVLSTPRADGPPESTAIAGVDLLGHVAWDGRSEDAEVALLSWDAHGVVGSAASKARVPLAAWARGAQKLDTHTLADLDVEGVVDVPKRDLGDLPAFLHVLGVKGKVDARARVHGSARHPQVALTAHVDGLAGTRDVDRRAGLQPVDGSIDARWNDGHAVATFGLTERPREKPERHGNGGHERNAALPGGRQRTPPREPGYVHGLLLGQLTTEDLFHRKPGTDLPWKASGQVEAQNVPLAGLPIPGRFTGVVTGRARLLELNSTPSFEANAHIDGFGAEGAKIDAVDLSLSGKDHDLTAKVEAADHTDGGGGKATFALTSTSLHVQGVDVGWDEAGKTRLDYEVQNLRLALAAPVVRKSVSELDGLVNGKGSVSLDGGSQAFEGGLEVQNGTLYVNSLGEQIGALKATAQFDKSGAWKIENATGKVGTGEFTAQASGRMQGFSFVDAEASIVASKGGIPISSEAATFAEAVGEVKITAKESPDRKSIVATVEIPKANVGLPDRSPQKLEPLTEDPSVAIGVRRKNGELDTSIIKKKKAKPAAAGDGATKTPPTTTIQVTLGRDVHLQGRGIDVSLGGHTLVGIADQVRVTGQIELRSGSIEVHGRRFTIDHGTVSFLEGADPGNPTIIVAAYWDSPDGTKVWVEFTGPLKTGKLTLRSEPALSKTEILSVLLFGMPDPNLAAASGAGGSGSSGGDSSGATAIGTGLVADDLNRVLSDIDENLDIETDTLEGNRARTKLGRSFFDRRLKVQVGYAPGQTSYREPDTTFVFLNWQFVPKWTLVATRGDQGTSILDVLFQHRY